MSPLKDRRQMIQGLALALLLTLCGFLLFVRPHLSSEAGATRADRQTESAALSALAPQQTTPAQLEEQIRGLAQGVEVRAIDVTEEQGPDGPVFRVSLEASGPAPQLLGFAAALSQRTHREGAQIRGEGPLFLIESMTLSPVPEQEGQEGEAPATLQLTALVPKAETAAG